MSKVNRTKSPLFFPLESLETRLDKFLNGLDKFSNSLKRLETRLEHRSSKFSRIEDRESSFKYRASRACQLTFEQYCTLFSFHLTVVDSLGLKFVCCDHNTFCDHAIITVWSRHHHRLNHAQNSSGRDHNIFVITLFSHCDHAVITRKKSLRVITRGDHTCDHGVIRPLFSLGNLLTLIFVIVNIHNASLTNSCTNFSMFILIFNIIDNLQS